jgi:hypothetical protein
MKTCHCGEEFEDLFFITCPKCRLPDKKPHKVKRFRTNRNKPEHWEESGSSFDNVVRASEE